MFPATVTCRPAARKIAPSSAVVVVFPFVPVTPTKREPGSSRKPSSTSDHTGTPRSRAATSSGIAGGTPGVFTTTSTPSSSDRSSSLPSVRSTGTTSSPRSASRSVTAFPDTPSA